MNINSVRWHYPNNVDTALLHCICINIPRFLDKVTNVVKTLSSEKKKCWKSIEKKPEQKLLQQFLVSPQAVWTCAALFKLNKNLYLNPCLITVRDANANRNKWENTQCARKLYILVPFDSVPRIEKNLQGSRHMIYVKGKKVFQLFCFFWLTRDI